jgi:hypothetical protein
VAVALGDLAGYGACGAVGVRIVVMMRTWAASSAPCDLRSGGGRGCRDLVVLRLAQWMFMLAARPAEEQFGEISPSLPVLDHVALSSICICPIISAKSEASPPSARAPPRRRRRS